MQVLKLRSVFAVIPTLAAAVLLLALSSTGCQENTIGGAAGSIIHPRIEKKYFGTTSEGGSIDKFQISGSGCEGRPVTQYILTNGKGASVSLLDYGATVTSLTVPDKTGAMSDVILGFDNIKQYQEQSPYFGAIIGRVGNRIAHGIFNIDKQRFCVPINNGPNHLHGGFKGYDKRIWDSEALMTTDGPSVRFTLTDPDGTEGYPGTVKITVIYSLASGASDDNGPYSGLKIQYYATTDRATPINLTNHMYFNLKDAGKSTVENHQVKIYGDHYTPVDSTLIPTGEIATVKGTPFDFTSPKAIGKDLAATGGDPDGYDHNFVLTSQDGSIAKAAQVYEPDTGRLMDTWTTQPGVQFYTGNFLDGSATGKGGTVYKEHSAFCLETQHYPDAVNQPNFPSAVLRPGETYRQITEYRFSTPAKAPW